MATVCYIRVSTVSQNEERQLAGMTFDREFVEKVSGAELKNRPQLQALVDYVRDGDVCWVHEISRLARSTVDLISTVKALNAKGCTVKFLKENLTFSADKKDPNSKLMLTLLGAVAEFTRSIINDAAEEGRVNAKAKGVKFGRIPKLTPERQQELLDRVHNGANKVILAKEYGISRATLYNILKP